MRCKILIPKGTIIKRECDRVINIKLIKYSYYETGYLDGNNIFSWFDYNTYLCWFNYEDLFIWDPLGDMVCKR